MPPHPGPRGVAGPDDGSDRFDGCDDGDVLGLGGLGGAGRGGAGARRPRRYRWALDRRAAAAAGLVVLIAAGGIAVRLSLLPTGAPVELPEPMVSAVGPAGVDGAAPGTTAAGDGEARPAGRDAGAAPATAAPPTAAAVVLVHVVGAVARPGVVALPPGARLAEALEAAGGATAEADLAAVNLARAVTDGEQVRVPRTGETAAAAAPGSAPAAPATGGAGATGTAGAAAGTSGAGAGPAGGAPADLATATAAELDALPGLGPVLAARVVEHRASTPFTTVDDLLEVPGIGPALLERLRDHVTVGG
ncbi:ComEA family DNA-binding protein [Cellulomonas endophytica]|uniref:ComEA family DNA-binding protein n=1 Tax=Cellulomonas endophytica TaxID=2494735 RepID=UPI001F0CC30F|nr:helix-hairpin-helix domain-containing protein [Cellulomonas endophytica]